MLRVNAKSGEIFIYDAIGADWFGEGITAASVSDALDQLQGKRATVRINSPGGSVDDGIAIYNALKRYSGGVDTFNDSIAASIASIIFLAGENRTMSAGSRVMIHKALTIDIGNSTQFRKTADVLDAHDRSLVEIYSGVMQGVDGQQIMALLDAETWYNSQEAVDIGLATALDSVATNERPKNAAWFRNAPENLFGSSTIAASNRKLDQMRMRNRLAKSKIL